MMLSFLITHYKRVDSLKKCVQKIHELELSFSYEIIVSDDYSGDEYIQEIQKLAIDKLILAKKNSGLASNINKGIDNCSGKYILYCQEDFLLKKELANILPECFSVLDSGKVEMIRFRANYVFNKLIPITSNINKIPTFSFKNFLLNFFRYSDNPFIVNKSFFTKYGNYLDNTSGPYGETEYATRILKLNAKVGITNTYYTTDDNVDSVLRVEIPNQVEKFSYLKKKRIVYRSLRAFRHYLEWFLYDPQKRKLYTYKNKRK